jgi:hypothetical protein
MNLRFLQRLAAVILFVLPLGTLPARAAEAIFPQGSRIGLVPPGAMTPSKRFQGFEDPGKQSAIVLVELPREAYENFEKGMTAEALKAQGVSVERRDEVKLKDGKGILVVAAENISGTPVHRWLILLSASNLTAIITLQVPDTARDTYTDALCRTTLESIVLRPEVPAQEMLAVLPYAMRDLAGFRVVRARNDGSVLLTEGPNNELGAVEQPFLVVTLPLGPTPDPAERENFAKRILASVQGFKEIKITRSEPLRIGGQQGFEILADAKAANSDTDVTLVQWIRFGAGGHLHMLGIARRDAWAKIYPRMRAVRDGIESK